MFKGVKILMLPLLLAAILAGLVFGGCRDKGAGEELGQQDLQQVLADSLLAVKNASSYQFSLDMAIDIEARGGTEAGRMAATMKSSGVTDIAGGEMQMSFGVYLKENTFGIEEGSQDYTAEMYMLTDYMYMKVSMAGMAERWIKTAVSEQMKKYYDLDMVEQQFGPLEAPVKIELLRYETFDGSECYVLNISPDMASMKEWYDGQQTMFGDLDWDKVVNLQDVFKKLNCNTWIARDTGLMKKMNMTMLLEISPAQAGTTESQFEKMNMDIEMSMIIKNYNEPVSITLPEEAENAVEI